MEKILCSTIHEHRHHDCSYVDVGTVLVCYTVFDVSLYLLFARVPWKRLPTQLFKYFTKCCPLWLCCFQRIQSTTLLAYRNFENFKKYVMFMVTITLLELTRELQKHAFRIVQLLFCNSLIMPMCNSSLGQTVVKRIWIAPGIVQFRKILSHNCCIFQPCTQSIGLEQYFLHEFSSSEHSTST